jgi:hypothetical protein
MKPHLTPHLPLLLLLVGTSGTLQADLPDSYCPIPAPLAVGPYVFYEDRVTTGVTFSDVWGTSHSEVPGDDARDDQELRVHYQQPYGSVGFASTTGFLQSLYDSISLTVRSEDPNDLTLYFKDEFGGNVLPFYSLSQYTLEGEIGSEDRTVTLPITDVVLTYQRLGGFLIESNQATTVHIDDVQLNLATPGLVTLFDDHLHAVFEDWSATASVSPPRLSFAGSHAIRLAISEDWGGMKLFTGRALSETDFGAITFAVKGDINGAEVGVYLLDAFGKRTNSHFIHISDYLHDQTVTTGWQVVWIPLNDLIPRPQQDVYHFHGIGLEAYNVDPNNLPDVWLDEVKVVEHLEWPLPEFQEGNENGGYQFGGDWQVTGSMCDGEWKLHAGQDFAVNQETGKSVVAAHAGKVLFAGYGSNTDWGGYVVIQSRGSAFVTVYTHIAPSTTVNQMVGAGDPIGVTSEVVGSKPHLDFKIRFGDYDLDRSLRGAYPRDVCGGLPAFPEKFVDPALIWPLQSQ